MEVRRAVFAVTESLIDHLKKGDETKYGPITSRGKEFQRLVEDGEYEDVRVGDLPAGQYGTIKEIDGTSFLVFDTENIPQEVLEENSDVFLRLHKDCDGFALENRGGVAKTVKEGDELIDSIFGRFSDKLPRRFLPVLEEALVLRITDQRQSLSRGTIYDWRGEIANQHQNRGHDPQEAHHLISLCSTGYFDQGNVFDNMYTNLVEEGEKTRKEFKDIMDIYVRKNPFAVFVQASGMTPEEVITLLLDKSRKIDRFPGSPKFIDICGKGRSTFPTIDQCREELISDFNADVEPHRDPKLDQYILRVETGSF